MWKEQGGICAYCGSRIDNVSRNDDFFLNNNDRLEKGTTRREHLNPKSLSDHRDKILLYSNLLAVCQGNEVPNQQNNPNDFHCDAKKKKDEIPSSIFPTNPNCELNFGYEEDENDDMIKIITDVRNDKGENPIEINLGLNFRILKERRYTAKEKSSDIVSEFKTKNLKRDKLLEELEKSMISQYTKDESGRFQECCFVTRFFLQKEIDKLRENKNQQFHI